MTAGPGGEPPRPVDGAATPPPSPLPPDEAPAAADGDWTLLSVPVDEPPGPIGTDADVPRPSWVGAIPGAAAPAPPAPAPGPPGGSIFTLEGRPAPALYLIAWLFSGGGLALLFITSQAAPSGARTLMGIGAILAIALGLSAGAGYQVVARRDRAPRWYRGPAPLLVFGVVLALSGLASGLLGAIGLVDAERPFGFLLGLLVVAFVYALAVWLFVVRSDALSWADMGWPTAGADRLRQALQGVGVGALVMVPGTFAALLIGGVVATILGVQAPDVVPDAATSAEAFAVALAAAVVAPIGEELFFRGFALTAWARDLPERSALIRSALFFALVHIANINATSFREGASQALLQVVVIGPIGLVLGWLFLRRGIMAAIAGHVTYNGILLALVAISAGSAGS